MKKTVLAALLLLGACDSVNSLLKKDDPPASGPVEKKAKPGEATANETPKEKPASGPAAAPGSGPAAAPGSGPSAPGAALAGADALPPGMPAADGPALLAYITKTSPYTSWKTLPRRLQPITISTEPLRADSIRFFNGMIARIYYNEIGQSALARNETQMPPGTVIVVERWAQKADGSLPPEETPDDLVVMYKVNGFDPANGDWFYLVAKGGEVKVAGGPDAAKCQACHALVKENDYRFTDSGKMDLVKASLPAPNDGGDTFSKSLLGFQPGGLHYTHYRALPDQIIDKNISRSGELELGIEWFNGKLDARLFANSLAFASLEAGAGQTFPAGSVLVAEQFERDAAKGTLADRPFAIVAQVKIEGADPDHGDWVWLSYSLSDQKILTFGKDAKFCYDCHAQVASNDYVWTTSGKRPKTSK